VLFLAVSDGIFTDHLEELNSL